MSVTFYFNDTVRKVYHKDGSLYYSFITHNITENKFVSIYINTADVLEEDVYKRQAPPLSIGLLLNKLSDTDHFIPQSK